MIVCDIGDRWQVVMQTDHADLSGELARRWADQTERSESLTIAAERHDDGWAVWEQSPAYDPGASKPVNFLDVNVLAHLAFYRAGIAAITEQDAYAGLLVSMHGAGIYRRRYGLQPELQLTFADGARREVDAFVAEQEGAFEAKDAELSVTAEQRQRDYELLQMHDRISLLFCMNDTLSPGGGEFGGYSFRGEGSAVLAMDPYPFSGGEQQFSLVRRLLPKRQWPDADSFRHELFATESERTTITVRAAN
jgi:hypothetical protein